MARLYKTRQTEGYRPKERSCPKFGYNFIVLASTTSFEESQCLTLSLFTQPRVTQTDADMRGPMDKRSHPDRNVLDGSEREEREEKVEKNEQEKLGEEECVISDQDYDTDLELRGIEKVDFG